MSERSGPDWRERRGGGARRGGRGREGGGDKIGQCVCRELGLLPWHSAPCSERMAYCPTQQMGIQPGAEDAGYGALP